MKVRRFTGLTSLGVAVFVLTSFLPAHAATSSANDQAARIESFLSADAATPLQPTLSGNGFAAVSGDSTITVPRADPDAVTLTSSDGVGLDLSLPDVNAASGSVADDGTIVYPGTGADLFVQPLEGGVRAGTIINSPTAGERFAYGIDSLTPSIEPDGSARFTASNEDALIEGPSAAAPWAYDANGVVVPTHYEVDGSSLVQVVEHQGGGYAYPITADPEWGWEGVLLWAYFTRSGTQDMSNAGYVAMACGGFTGMIGPVFAGLCAANAGSIAYNASNAYNHGKLTIGPGVVLTQEYRDWRCY
ncbi:hypothetical protein [Plantibacter sp. YIM 135347]|uniref:hypothetical protein n=1 Tax=Plantibacter sp. YIM 135347 TaxID=3423919 RepID=UPI003D32A39E